MKKIICPQDQNFWYLKRPNTPSLHAHKETEIVVIGGGMAGLTTAQAFAQKGKKVVLLESHYCGAGASGKSSGFIEPNGEISLSEFISRYGAEGAQTIWESIQKHGVEHIRNNIKQYQIDCDYTEEDSLELASTQKDVAGIIKEAENLAKFGYTTKFITKEDIPQFVNSNRYHGGVTYPNSFGISAYKYCQEMKNVLIKNSVEIYEETPVLNIQEHLVTTLHATVKADYIIVCADRFIPTLGLLTKEIYHVQNFLLVSESLTPDAIHTIFPQKKLMVWDTELIYNFYRMTGDRLLIGGGSVLNVYDANPSYHNQRMYKKLSTYIKNTFPDLEIQFEQMWPGLIGVSKDIAPLTGFDKDIKSVYYIGAAAGLPIAAMLGNYCVDHILDGADTLKNYFSPYRKFPIGGALQTVLGTKLTFAISNWVSHGNT
ncbi:MAG TPA: FAD-binding oxidoreductase [Candidatus Babeliales bacterium]|jgi:gamma-glutamylputrescine oxidase|nr:FAD-binding oxidoreductase [Candidatus Babeliales bacterium]